MNTTTPEEFDELGLLEALGIAQQERTEVTGKAKIVKKETINKTKKSQPKASPVVRAALASSTTGLTIPKEVDSTPEGVVDLVQVFNCKCGKGVKFITSRMIKYKLATGEVTYTTVNSSNEALAVKLPKINSPMKPTAISVLGCPYCNFTGVKA